MKFEISKYVCIVLAVLAVSCEKLEDTYSDYVGDGVVRYLGKPSNVSVSSGWKRLVVKWTNSVDPAIVNIKVQWDLDDVSKDTLLAKDVSEFSIENLEDGNYEISVAGVDKNGSTSLSSSLYARPYTEEHEVIRSFTRIVAKHAYIEDRLVLFFSDWQSNVDSASLNYYTKEGELKHLELTSDFCGNNKYYLLEDAIDPSKDVSVYRRGRVEGCEDLIVFDPYVLSHDKLYTTDFKQWAKEKYGQEEITDAWINSLTEIEFDYDLNSFEDLLNMPNLERLVLGKGRYMNVDRNDTEAYSMLIDMERSLFTLDVLYELKQLKVERYSNHYFVDEVPDYVEEKGNTNEQPNVEFVDGSNWIVSCSVEDEGDFDSHLDYLFDGDINTNWQTELSSAQARTYEIEVNMQEVRTVTGVRVLQNSFEPRDMQGRRLMPTVVKIETSSDRLTWENATHVEDNTLGDSNGEATYLYFKAPKDVRYLRFTFYDQAYGQNFGIRLAGIDVF